MTWLNPALLAGAAAAAIPVIIHLLNRRRFRVVRWSAMMFLEDVLRTNRRRIRIEQWLLLAIRAAIPALLALAMARPVITGAGGRIRRAPTSAVILLDNSASMEVGEAGRSALAAAREAAGAMLEELPRGSEAAVIGMAGPLPLAEEPTVDLAQLRQAVADAEGGWGAARPAAALQRAAALLEQRMHHADRLLVIISDFQRANWSTDRAEERRRAWTRLAAQPVPPRVVLLPIRTPPVDNVAVGPVEVSRGMLGAGQTLRVRAAVRLYGGRPRPHTRVHFRVNGVELKNATVRLEPGAVEFVQFAHVFDRAGSHIVEIGTEADAFRPDNVAAASVIVADRLPVRLVSGDPNPVPLRSETAFLELALQPWKTGAGRAVDLVEASTVPEARAEPAHLRDTRVVVLANIRQLSAALVEALATFVREGGGVLVAPGDRASPSWAAAALDEAAGLLPARLSGILGRPDDEAGAVGFAGRWPAHPALAGLREGALSGARIRARYRLEVPIEREDGVLLRLETGEPWMVERRVGEGRVILLGGPVDADWSNLPFQPAFVPLMQELIIYLGSVVHPPRNVDPGERLAARLDENAAAGERAVLTLPDGAVRELPVTVRGLHRVVEFGETDRPGIYRLRPPGGAAPIAWVVRRPPEESELAPVSEQELAALAAEASATVVESPEAFRRLERERREGRELWRAAWWGVLGLLGLELIVQRRLGGRAR
ncbi:MAG: BatA domain-containing protein [Kiritimatiellae bacterium]|nr:BatA domain-containing protein [Kiritimatiellia bacterium]